MKKIVFVLICCTALLSACKKTSTSYSPDCSGATKTFATDVSPLITSYCKGCHSQYSGYSQISADKSAIRNSIVSGSMPKGSTMTDAEKNNIVCWIDDGAPNN